MPLILNRKLDEGIEIKVGDDVIFIKVVEIRQSRCRILIEAPKEFRILRDELEVTEDQT